MKKQASKFLFIILTTLILISVAATFYRYLVIRDYETFMDLEEEETELLEEL
ncbi:hypothetical protein KC723_01065 [Candidatus Kaiserbacteria bacterium]|nr:hypothetical protein [Candidatus Kaiserbacteria bacterium]